jgi:hypothetical protein
MKLKKIFPGYNLVLIFMMSLFSSCSSDRYKEIEHKWVISSDEVVLEFHPDSTFTVTERGVPSEGKWKLSEDQKSIQFKKKAKGEQSWHIKTLTDSVLILSSNGAEMEYARGN